MPHSHARSQHRHSTGSTLSYLTPQLVVFLGFILLMVYVLWKQRQRFSEIRVPSGVLPHPGE